MFCKFYERRCQRQTYGSDFGRQMGEDKKCPFNGVTNYGRVWRKGAEKRVLENDSP